MELRVVHDVPGRMLAFHLVLILDFKLSRPLMSVITFKVSIDKYYLLVTLIKPQY